MKRNKLLMLALILFAQVVYAQKIDVYKRPKQVERSRDYDAVHYRLKFNFDFEKKIYDGENTITLTPLKDEFIKCILDAEEMTVNSVLSERDIPLKFEQTDRYLTVYLSKAYAYDDTLSFAVSYKGNNPKKGLYFNDETPENPRLISTVSFPDNAHHWFPCYDFPNDKATQEVIATVKAPNKVLSNGRLMGTSRDDEHGTITYHWLQDIPHSTYLYMLAAGPFEIIRDSLGSVLINHWVYKKDLEVAREAFKRTPQIMEFFNRQFGYSYPWAKCDRVTIPNITGGAESTSATCLGQSLIFQERCEQVVAHELAHQWWGDLITLRTWSETWLNEGFGTYGDHLYAEEFRGADEGAVDLMVKKNRYLREAHTRYMRPIVFDRYDSPGNMFDGHTYPKAANVIHMMRFVLGDKLFFRTIQYFLHKHAFQPVDTHAFMTAVKDVTGQNLEWFFDQWLYKPGHPVFDVSYTWNENSGKLALRIVQTQDTSIGVPIYRMPVNLGIVTPEGKTIKKIWIKEKNEEFEFEVKQKPLLVRFDEGNFLLKEWTFKKELNELLYQLSNDDVIGRMWAAHELLNFKDDYRAVDNLRTAAVDDPFWGVRKNAVETIGNMKKTEDISFLKERCKDSGSKVRISAIQALGEFNDALLVAFFKERFYAEDNLTVQTEILRAIGKCGDHTAVQFLKDAGEIKSPRKAIKRAAESALKEIESR